MTATGATASLADFVADTTLDDIPEQARTRLAQCLLDFIGVAAAGSRYGESSRAIRTALRSVATGGDTTVVADPDPWPQPYAAMLNGSMPTASISTTPTSPVACIPAQP